MAVEAAGTPVTGLCRVSEPASGVAKRGAPYHKAARFAQES